MLSRCFILWWLLVKMSHLWAREVLFCIFQCVWCGCNFHAVKMFHLMAASRQDVPSFAEGAFVCGFVCVCMMFS